MINTRIIEIDPRELKLLKMNARFMRHEEFQRLVANIKRDGQLTSAPFAALDPADGKYEVLSGNHRVQAAISAGLQTIPCIITDDPLSEEQRIAIQLSHNAIVGQDDPDILKKLYDKILDIDLKEYSGLDDKTLGLLDKAQSQAMSEANLEFQVLSIVYLPDELKAAQAVIDKARDAVKNCENVWLATDKEYEKWLDAQEIASSAYNVKNVSAAILNSLVIDADGENYDFKTFQFSGVKDVIDATCNMLSALTNIPQTILFGRSPAGMNATGTSDFESYYNFVEKIQRLMLKRNLRTLLDVIFRAGIASGAVEEEPDYKLEFNPLWSLSDTEQATVDQTKAQTAQIKAQTAQVYVDMQALDPTEVRKRLASDEEFDVEDIISEGEDDDDLLQALLGSSSTDTANEVEAAQMNAEQQQTPGGAVQSAPASGSSPAVTDNADGDTNRGVGVLIIQDGKLLCGTRVKEGSIGGPGGHIEAGESPEAAAIRETQEEFGITPKDLIPLTYIADLKPPYCPSQVYLCTDFDGSIKCDDDEMTMPGFIAADKVLKLATEHPERIFPPFAESVSALLDVLTSDSPLTADGQNGRMNSERTDADSDKIRWITTESGTHIPLDDEGKAVGGFAKGQKFPSAKSEPSKPASNTPEHKADPQHKSEPKASSSNESSPATAASPKSFGSADAPNFAKSLKTAYDKMEETAPEKAWRVTVHTQQELEEEYPGAKLHITEGGSTVAVTKDGDIISVCGNPGDKLRGKDLLKLAVENGGKKLDSYSGNHGFYVKCGFEAVSWCEFDEQYAPPGWVKGRDKPEPVIFYKYTGKSNQSLNEQDIFNSIPASADYDAAQSARNQSIESEEKHE